MTHDEQFWRLHLATEYGVSYVGDLSGLDDNDDSSPQSCSDGVVHDPTLQGNREMSVIYSTQFKKIMIDRNQSRGKNAQVMINHNTVLRVT